jgi:hypothetical protein
MPRITRANTHPTDLARNARRFRSLECGIFFVRFNPLGYILLALANLIYWAISPKRVGKILQALFDQDEATI